LQNLSYDLSSEAPSVIINTDIDNRPDKKWGKASYSEDGCNASNIGIRNREHSLKALEQISVLQNYYEPIYNMDSRT
jgi:hypothetical protein